ncbi:N-terminal binuclear Zn cluster-containing/DNA binding domain-containing protein [Trichoderma citrinoviride]|uniref:N-terminal binuclear Zn cluster-containing/DNA binding domain-containing protein n=1 Tax=Trichoderma citrinoviride TaxID=58853 RepID=A0A2T4BEC7_9HYPO|nr:N-terminal binuclear Zn cluster-containing/DNA binding domain-containing protein [Trichoderma citrinoviride]PTB67591.1 N-terminal binuclear Zn cluster-containing/DNA binding domain-containing protein [Trichoderma citrinoviride]
MDLLFQQPQPQQQDPPTVHNPPNNVPEKKRRRPPLSCEQCRRRKVRCDRSQPCNKCVESNAPSCTYAPVHIPAWRAKKLDLAANTIGNGGSSSINNSNGGGDAAAAVDGGSAKPHKPTSLDSTSASSKLVSSNAGTSSAASSPNVDWLVARVQQLEERLAKALRLSDAPDAQKRLQAAPEMTEPAEGFVAKSRFYGHSHWLYGVNILTVEQDLVGQEKVNQGELWATLGRCKALGRKIKKNRLRPLSSTNLGAQIPERELADVLVDNYLRTFEGVFRVVHIPTFRADYARFWEDSHPSNESFAILLQLVMALGAALYDDVFSLRPMATQWIFEAQMWLMMPPEKKRINMEGIQIQCLLLLAKSTCNVGADMVWMMAGNLVRNAMFVGLHRDPQYLGDLTVYRAEMRRRLWATVLELNLQFSFEGGGSPLLSTAHYDTLPPANLNDDELTDEKDSARLTVKSPKVPTQTSVLRALVATIPLRMNLITHVNSTKPGDHYEETLRLNSDLTKSCRAVSETLLSLQAAPHSPITPFHVLVTEILLYRCFHALHQPVIVKHLDDARFFFSRQMCLDSAMKITHIWGLPDAWTGDKETAAKAMDADLKRLVTNGTGFFRNVATQAMIIIQIELLNAKAGQATSLGYLPTVGSANLHARLNATRTWSLERVRAGETNIKGIILMTACLAHVKALEQGVDAKHKTRMMFQAALDISQQCLEILKGVAEREGLPRSEWEDGGAGAVLDEASVTSMAMDWMQEWNWDDGGGQGISFPQWEADFEGAELMDDLGFDVVQF